MADYLSAFHEIVQLLRGGKVQEADELASKFAAALAHQPPEPPAPIRAAVAIPSIPSWVSDVQLVLGLLQQFMPLLESLVQSAGNQPAHVAALKPIQETLWSLATKE